MNKKASILYPNTVPALFLRRLNRFTAEVLIDGKTETVHVKNTGRLKELLLPEAEVTLQKSGNPNRKTAYDLISVYKPGFGWVNIDSLVPNGLMKLYLENQGYDLVKPEYTYGKSRFDFYMEKDGEQYLTEVKGCTLAADWGEKKIIGLPGEKRIFGLPEEKEIIGLFPDAPTQRGVKHLNELAEAAREGYHCAISFVIQMNGISRVLPNDETQPAFGEALAQAVEAGVQVICYQCRVEKDRIEIVE